MATGFVSSLAKKVDAQQVDEFRSVVVYRLVDSIGSGQAFVSPALTSFQCSGWCSNETGQATLLEMIYVNGDTLHGILMDIQKCFNNQQYPST